MTLRSILPALLVLSLMTLVTCPVYAQQEGQTTEAPKAPPPAQRQLEPDQRVVQQNLMPESPPTRAASRSAEVRPRAATGSGNLRPQIATRGAALRDQLAKFKNRQKATIIERISNNLTNVNQRRTSAMLQHVDVLSGIVVKAEDKITEAETAGIDVTDAKTELGLSKTALANAKTAVQEQSKKTYEIRISTESAAKADVKETRDLLEQDLKSTHSLVKESRRILLNALTKLQQTLGGGSANESR